MATKDQERKALEQIRKIVEGLGEDSYIAIAMDGVLEDARENIENDWAMSWKDRAQTAEQACDLRREEAHKLWEENEKLKKELDETKEDLEYINGRKNEYKAAMEQESRAKVEAERKVEELEREADRRVEELENEVIRLKAKLYDLLVK